MIDKNDMKTPSGSLSEEGPSGLEVCSLTVRGLDCAACAEKIEKALMRHRGVDGVTVYLGAEKIDVHFMPSAIGRKAIENIINGIGYRVIPEKGGPLEKTSWSFDLWRIGIVLFLILLGVAGAGRDTLQSLFGIKFSWDILAILPSCSSLLYPIY